MNPITPTDMVRILEAGNALHAAILDALCNGGGGPEVDDGKIGERIHDAIKQWERVTR